MHPDIPINMLAILACVVSNFALGGLWYGPLFGKKWAQSMGMADVKPTGAEMGRAMALNVVGAFLTAYVLAHSVAVWRASTWQPGAADDAAWTYGFFAAFFTWVGFFVPLQLNSVAWERRPWSLFGINIAYHFVSLQCMGMILTFWR